MSTTDVHRGAPSGPTSDTDVDNAAFIAAEQAGTELPV